MKTVVVFLLMVSYGCTFGQIIKMELSTIDCKANKGICTEVKKTSKLMAAKPEFGHMQALIDIELFNDKKDMYMMTTLYMGKDKKPIDLIIDSGSSATWINYDDCGKDVNGLAGDCERATTPNSLYYLDGEIHGKVAKTSVWLNNNTAESKNHDVTVIFQKSELMSYGIVGMARSSTKEKSFLQTLKENKVIAKKAFAIFSRGEDSLLVLGGVDHSLIEKDATEATTKLLVQNEFFFQIEGVKFGDDIVSLEFTKALADSGNTLISFPWYLTNPVIGTLKKQGIDCYLLQESNTMFSELTCKMSADQVFPDLHFVIAKKTFTVPGHHLKSDCYDNPNGFFYDDVDSNLKDCLIMIEFFANGNYFTLGKTFLQKVYTTFDLDENAITFVQNK